LRGYPADSSVAGYHHSAALDRGQRGKLVGWRIGILVGFSQAVAAQQKDFGVLDQAVGDGGCDGGVVEDVAPLGKGSVRGDDGGTLVAVTSGDDLIEKIRSLLIKG
jgi:hypothetical protein